MQANANKVFEAFDVLIAPLQAYANHRRFLIGNISMASLQTLFQIKPKHRKIYQEIKIIPEA